MLVSQKKIVFHLISCWCLLQIIIEVLKIRPIKIVIGGHDDLVSSCLIGTLFFVYYRLALRQKKSFCWESPIHYLPYQQKNDKNKEELLTSVENKIKLGTVIVSCYAILTIALYVAFSFKKNAQFLSISLSEVLNWNNILTFFSNCVIAPLTEEMFFRGFLMFALVNAFKVNLVQKIGFTQLFSTRGYFTVVYLNAIIFWFFHIPLEFMMQGIFYAHIGSFLMGFACSIIALNDRSYRNAFFLHALGNFMGFAWLEILKGLNLENFIEYFYSK
jgi:membrane protease YdiL (CAAX protease family)